jgi:DNA-binding NarL/FixJ family response regulator
VAAVTRVALVEDHALLAESLLVALAMEGLEVSSVPLGKTVDSRGLLDAILSLEPGIVLLDLDLGAAGDGVALVEPLTRAGCPVVVVTAAGEPERWGECLARGARTVLPKSTPLHDIVDVVRRVAGGAPVMHAARRAELIQRWHRMRADQDSVRSRLDRLTRRETQVLHGLMRGQRVRDIAREAYVSEATVRTQVKSILAKLGVTSQIAAIAAAKQAGWEPPTLTDKPAHS